MTGCVCMYFLAPQMLLLTEQNNKCNARDQVIDFVLRKLLCVKYLRRQVIDNHSKDLQAISVQDCQWNRAEQGEVEDNSSNFPKTNGKNTKQSYLSPQ